MPHGAHAHFSIEGEESGHTGPDVSIIPSTIPEDRTHNIHSKDFGESDKGGGGDDSESQRKNETYPPQSSPSFERPSSPPTPARKSWFHADSLPFFLAWIPPHATWKGMRPVIRASLAAWCGLLLLLGARTEALLGQASFLVLVVAALSPASTPIATVIEQTILQAVFVSMTWAWGCLGLFIAHQTRTQFKYTLDEFTALAAAPYIAQGLSAGDITLAVGEDVTHGLYLETTSSIVCAVFLGSAGGFLLWLRGHVGPGPILIPILLSIIMLVICLTIGPLFPYAYYGIGLVVFLPFICQAAITLLCSFLVLPETLAHQFSDRLIATLIPLQRLIQQQKGMLHANPRTEEWLEYRSIQKEVNAAIAGLTLLGASETNLTREVSYARVSGKDLTRILGHMRVLVSRSTGFVSFYSIVENHLHRDYTDAKGGAAADELVIHLGHTRPYRIDPQLPTDGSPDSTRPPSVSYDQEVGTSRSSLDQSHLHVPPTTSPRPTYEHSMSTPMIASPLSQSRPASTRSVEIPPSSIPDDEVRHGVHRLLHKKKYNRSASHISLPSLLHDVLQPHEVRPVGFFESQRYMDLEDFLSNPRDEAHLEEILLLLGSASSDLLSVLDRVAGNLISTIHTLKSSEGTWRSFINEDLPNYSSSLAVSASLIRELENSMAEYKLSKRLDVVRPFAGLFDPNVAKDKTLGAPSHRGLYWSFSYEYSLMGFAEALLAIAKETHQVQTKRRRPRIWTPDWAKFRWTNATVDSAFEDESPNSIVGLSSGLFTAARNPDFKPAKHARQVIGIKIYDATQIFSRADVLFGFKSAILLALVSLPAWFPSTAYFYYRERGVWVTIMAALTSTQFTGDTTFGFVVRVLGTFLGAIVGLTVWYIGAGSGRGNAIGIGAVSAVAIPMIMFYRVHYSPPVQAIIPVLTAMLIIGYSWQDAHQPALSSVGWGWDVAWRRFVCVCIGITAAFIFAYLPPRATQKATVRKTYAKVISEMGGIVCQITSFAHCKDGPTRPPKVIIANIAALRAKVAKTTASKTMIKYEVSLRGPWPAENYASLQTLQMEILDLLGQFLGVISQLDSKTWTRCLLHRSQLSNPRFLGDLLTSFQLISSSLSRGTPLPMIYNPLLERFLRPNETIVAGHAYGFEPTLDERVEGIPSHVTLETVCSIEYLRFSVGISLIYAIVNRMDRMMFVVKSLVGESYIVYGLEAESSRAERPEGMQDKWHGGDDSRRSSFESTSHIV